MRILFVITRADSLGGAQIHVRDLCCALISDGHTIGVATNSTTTLTEALESSGAQIFTVPQLGRAVSPVRDYFAYSKLRLVIQSFQPDVVSTHSSKAGALGRFAARAEGVPAVFTAHGWAFTDGVNAAAAAIYCVVERHLARRTSRIVTVSEFDRKLALARGVAHDHQIRTIRNAMPDVTPELRCHPAQEPPRLLMVARFQAQKDHATLFAALEMLKDESWHLDLVGSGPGMKAAQAAAERHGLTERVSFLGERWDVPDLFSSAQIYLLISNWEGLPRSIIEAFRAGMPVIATSVGGVAELVESGENGFLVARKDVPALVTALRSLLRDPALRTRMGANARALYEARFTFDRMYTETVALYRELHG